jgi:hypothetical protein
VSRKEKAPIQIGIAKLDDLIEELSRFLGKDLPVLRI